jgi:hypothetical protein
MFCPVCKAEYREGFMECSDCGVALVQLLSDDAGAPRNSEGLELLWSGVSQALSERIHDALDAAHIFHKVTEKDFGLLPNLAQSVKFVWIDSQDRTSSRSILEKILVGRDAREREAELSPPDSGRVNPYGLDRRIYVRTDSDGSPFESVSLFEPDSAGEPIQDDIAEDFDPAAATSEVWSGEDAEMAENIRICLREVGIGCELKQENGKSRFFVMPGSEARAREIVREIVEGTPPE